MSSGISRRGLLRALAAVSEHEDLVKVARIGTECVEPKGVSCRRCGEVCDENAIRFIPLAGGRASPVLDATLCSGCGECLAPCPTATIHLEARGRAAFVSGIADLEVRA